MEKHDLDIPLINRMRDATVETRVSEVETKLSNLAAKLEAMAVLTGGGEISAGFTQMQAHGLSSLIDSLSVDARNCLAILFPSYVKEDGT